MRFVYNKEDILPLIKFNELDEFGLKYQLNRNLDNDYIYQLKLLDIFIHKPNSSYNGLLYSFFRQQNIPKMNIGYIKYKDTATDDDIIKYKLEITDTHINIINVSTNEKEISIRLYYSTPDIWRRNENYDLYDLVLMPLNMNYGLLCIAPGTSGTSMPIIPQNFNIGDIINDNTIYWKIVKISEPRPFEEVVDEFNNINSNPFEFITYSYLSLSTLNIYASNILPTTNVQYIESKKIYSGQINTLEKYVELNSEYFNLFYDMQKNNTQQYLQTNQYYIDYINGKIILGNTTSDILISYAYHLNKINIYWSPLKLYTFNEQETINSFMYPMYINQHIVYEEDIETHQQYEIAYNSPMQKLKSLDEKQQKRFQIMWSKDYYIYDFISMFELLDNKKEKCEVIDVNR